MARGRRTASADANASSLSRMLAPTVLQQPMVSPTAYEVFAEPEFDQREYHPDQQARPPGALVRSAARLIMGAGTTIGFQRPSHVMICVRRKERREVLFAKNRTRSGAGKPRRRNKWSSTKC